jgi:UDP-N-acetylmuramoyl-L-alanyl-D-glutamate--2,6-diaminopimelate ligase
MMKLKAAGIHNIYNSLLAASAAIDLGLIPCEVKRSISDLPKICGRYEIIKDDVTVIIDYAHTDIALESMLKSLTLLKQNENGITVIFGCGGERDKSKRARMARVAERYAVKTVVTTDNPRGEDEDKIIADILSGFTKQSHKTVKNREQAITETILNAQKGNVIAIIGKGAEKYTIDKSGYHSFDEHKIVFDALKTRREGKLK